MAENNARREARRRRILENSKSRLRKITGKVNPSEIEDNDPQVESDSFKAELNFEEDNIKNGICNINNDIRWQDCTRFDDRQKDFLNDTNNKNIHSAESKASKSEFMLCTLLLNRINFVLLAGIVNILFVLKLDNLFGRTVIIPYLLLMVGRLCSRSTLQEAQDNRLLIAALMLCNVKPRIIYVFRLSFKLFTIALNDFCLYIFSFILMRYVIIRYCDTVSINT